MRRFYIPPAESAGTNLRFKVNHDPPQAAFSCAPLTEYHGGMSEQYPTSEWIIEIDGLVRAWCDRRELAALREILGGWPLCSGLTDEWDELAISLKRIAAIRSLPMAEREAAKRLYVKIDSMARRP
jgi:hypothetical protein